MSKKKRAGKSSYTSKGIVGHPKRCRERDPMKRLINQQNAWLAGKHVMLTIDNPDQTATNMRKIRVNARDVWGLPPMLRRKEQNAS